MRDFGRTMQDLAARQARIMRGKAQAAALKRKEQYLGARVPKELRNKVIAQARSLGIPVSILIRNVLEEAFGADTRPTGASAMGGASATEGKVRFPDVIGWKDIVLNKTMHCSSCQRVLEARTPATLGLGTGGGEPVVLCSDCSRSI
jgi:predicted DNA binding CopG/RHH family protein